jgi:hypothetical protein
MVITEDHSPSWGGISWNPKLGRKILATCCLAMEKCALFYFGAGLKTEELLDNF